MQKLIELLNEYWRQKEWVYWIDYQADMDFTNREKTLFCSKYRWWIEWLVENEKIDIKALVVKGEMRSWWDFDNKKWNEESGEEIWNKYYSELCLMILAIQDEPINFLISILK